MTRDDAKTILRYIASVYDNFKVTSEKVDMWHMILADRPLEQMTGALAAFIRTDTKGYPPVPGQLIEQVSVQNETLTDAEAWASVKTALRNSLYSYEEEYEKLTPFVQRSVGSAQMLQAWARMPSDEVNSVIQSQFLRSYRAVKERAKEDAKIPQNVRLVLRSTGLIEDKEVAQ